MKKTISILSCLFFIGILSVQSQSIFGKWKTIDDETGNEKSIVEIYQKDGKAYAKIVELLEKGKEDKVCEECKGAKKNKPIKGMEIINGLSKDGDEWNDAKILDPKTGKEYKCYITLDGTNKLKVRGYVGFALLGRTQFWHKVEE
ncbi:MULTISPECIES: DUF2147 domain-containing protein [Flavobacteriaceae]|uniref:DUF2147 domain-containing protein n=2 Tax=Flavobacteriaceae TaxID=49546 RepID=A0A4Y8AW28_9FLAO|nr:MULTISPECIES: DUF2147 domain-containing protein [Flavobacteriaceae]TEW76691.1 DUF2147 domain-containing protein [Gramella jeungdoensis]GGK50817.1 hypothetical protein GCM10007963_19010 [Lutibacter litoralis]